MGGWGGSGWGGGWGVGGEVRWGLVGGHTAGEQQQQQQQAHPRQEPGQLPTGRPQQKQCERGALLHPPFLKDLPGTTPSNKSASMALFVSMGSLRIAGFINLLGT